MTKDKKAKQNKKQMDETYSRVDQMFFLLIKHYIPDWKETWGWKFRRQDESKVRYRLICRHVARKSLVVLILRTV